MIDERDEWEEEVVKNVNQNVLEIKNLIVSNSVVFSPREIVCAS